MSSTAIKTIEPEPLPAARNTPMEMLAIALGNGASVEVLNGLMTLQERWEKGLGRKAYDAAIAGAKGEIGPILKTRTVDFSSSKGRTNYRYEDLAEIAKTVDPVLTKHGLSYRFRASQDGGAVTVTCIIAHKDGYSEETTLSAAEDHSGNKNSIQAIGSTVTYLQRYTLKLALGLAASVDDDGRSAGIAVEDARVISDKQHETLRNMLTGRDINAFLSIMSRRAERDIESLADLPSAMYGDAIATIKRNPARKS